MIEQEMASIIRFVLDAAENPSPYYWRMPQSFRIPSMYFPPPEITSAGDTFTTYALTYAWYIKAFGYSDGAAYELARKAMEKIRRYRNLIPLIGEDGEEDAEHYVRVDDPSVRMADTGVCTLSITFVSRRDYYTEDATMAETFETVLRNKGYAEAEVTEDDEAAALTILNNIAKSGGESDG